MPLKCPAIINAPKKWTDAFIMTNKNLGKTVHTESNTTDRAGILTPIAKVSVAKSNLTNPRAKSSSIVSFKIGKIPE